MTRKTRIKKMLQLVEDADALLGKALRMNGSGNPLFREDTVDSQFSLDDACAHLDRELRDMKKKYLTF